MTIARVKAKSKKQITELGTHELFKNALTEKAFERYTNEDIVAKSYIILHEEDPSLEIKVVRELLKKIDITENDMAQMIKIFNRILSMYNKIEDKRIAKRVLTRTHMISIVPTVWKSIEDELTDTQMANWFASFFSGKRAATISDIYNSCARDGSAKRDSVRNRLAELDRHYKSFFASKNHSYETE